MFADDLRLKANKVYESNNKENINEFKKACSQAADTGNYSLYMINSKDADNQNVIRDLRHKDYIFKTSKSLFDALLHEEFINYLTKSLNVKIEIKGFAYETKAVRPPFTFRYLDDSTWLTINYFKVDFG